MYMTDPKRGRKKRDRRRGEVKQENKKLYKRTKKNRKEQKQTETEETETQNRRWEEGEKRADDGVTEGSLLFTTPASLFPPLSLLIHSLDPEGVCFCHTVSCTCFPYLLSLCFILFFYSVTVTEATH